MLHLEFQCRHRWSSQFALEVAFSASQRVTALFGASGAGKTTVLSIIAGIVRPDQGVIRLNDRALLDAAAGVCVPPERRGIGYVPQDHLLFPHLSVRRNLSYGMKRRPSRPMSFDRVIEVLDLRELLDRDPVSLSGGQRQRVALGRAILRGPELLLMDEPLASLDAPMKHRILDYLERAVNEWDIAAIFVSHDQADVRRFAGGVVVMEHGRAVAAGPTAATLDRATTWASVEEHGPVNLLKVEGVERIEDHLRGTIGQQVLSFAGQMPNDAAGQVQHICFLPRDVMLSRGDLAGVSARNHLHGRVSEIVALPGRVFVAVAVGGQMLWTEITHDARRELAIEPGTPVTCHIKSTAIRVLQ